MNEPATKQPADTRVARADLRVAPELAAFLEQEALPGTEIDTDAFWTGLSTRCS